MIRDKDGDIVEYGRTIQGRCRECTMKPRRLTPFFCLCGMNALQRALLNCGRMPRGGVSWVCLGHSDETGQVTCMAKHFCMTGSLVEQVVE